ncbi:unnamed protein product [Blepharisma stoltei]|uniref:GST C-terminal domain-containing protein n=1 Tax=Blepharisma stoltei TaxID=1481888 RepID=A0AAU9IJ04_9CILI|nr:unnamed protein product [Blepharisma stoltei]
MGMLVNGEWHEADSHPDASGFKGTITKDGSSGYKAEPGRYYLYLSLVCPFSHRTLIMRKLKDLDNVIGVVFASPLKGDQGWGFSEEYPDTLHHFEHLYQLYQMSSPRFTGAVSVPCLWDSQTNTIVSNDSGDIMIMLNDSFEQGNNADFYPAHLRSSIDEMNQFLLKINFGVYRTGGAKTQQDYESQVDALFEALDRAEAILERQRYLLGDQITIADWRLYVTLVRFDAVHYGLMKCNLRTLESYENLSNFVRELYQMPEMAELTNIDIIKKGYYYSFNNLNPSRIYPKGPFIDFSRSHNRNIKQFN